MDEYERTENEKFYLGRLRYEILFATHHSRSHVPLATVVCDCFAVGFSTLHPFAGAKIFPNRFAHALTGSWSSFPHPRNTSRLSLKSHPIDNKKNFRRLQTSHFSVPDVPVTGSCISPTSC